MRLSCSGVTRTFGGTAALSNVDLTVAEGEIVGLIGPNGSGKSTLVNVITGFYRPTSGTVWLGDQEISGHAPHRLSGMGITRTFQNLRLFDELSVIENVLIGQHRAFLSRSGSTRTWLRHAVGARSARAVERAARRTAQDALDAAGLDVSPDARLTDLSYGQKKRLELARAIVGKPRVLLLDEPTAGLSSDEADAVVHLFARPVREEGLAVLLIEHRLDWVLACADRVAVLNAGEVIAEGAPAEVASDRNVMRVYVGE